MNNLTKYDVIVVYSAAIAKSVKNKQYKGRYPFPLKSKRNHYNNSYSYFLSKCKKIGIKAAFVSSKDIIAPGRFRSFWTYDKKWIRNYGNAYSKIIFDKFTPTTPKSKKRLKLLTSSKSIYTFNHKKMIELFQNKLNTYKSFKEFAIPTVNIRASSKLGIHLAKLRLDRLLEKHKSKTDFINGYIIKDKTGAGGK